MNSMRSAGRPSIGVGQVTIFGVVTSKNVSQHQVFLEAVGNDGALHKELVAWFSTLPLWIESPGFRVVHACWYPAG